jgi:hypothetical protein
MQFISETDDQDLLDRLKYRFQVPSNIQLTLEQAQAMAQQYAEQATPISGTIAKLEGLGVQGLKSEGPQVVSKIGEAISPGIDEIKNIAQRKIQDYGKVIVDPDFMPSVRKGIDAKKQALSDLINKLKY